MLNITKIESLIKDKGWSNSYFCTLFRKNAGWIKDWKHGKGLPDENMLQAIADKLDTTVEYITDKTDIKEQKNSPSQILGGLSDKEKLLIERIRSLPPEQQELFYRAAGAEFHK